MDSFVNPPQVLKEEARKRETEREKERAKPSVVPEQPERDVLLFLLEHAPLKAWQHDVLAIIREEAYYFAPRARPRS